MLSCFVAYKHYRLFASGKLQLATAVTLFESFYFLCFLPLFYLRYFPDSLISNHQTTQPTGRGWARHGIARQSKARRGKPRQGFLARRGLAWRCAAWRGKPRQGFSKTTGENERDSSQDQRNHPHVMQPVHR